MSKRKELADKLREKFPSQNPPRFTDYGHTIVINAYIARIADIVEGKVSFYDYIKNIPPRLYRSFDNFFREVLAK